MVAKAGQRVPERLGAGAVVRVLEDAMGLLQSLGRFEDAARQPDGQEPEDERASPMMPSVGTTSDAPRPEASP